MIQYLVNPITNDTNTTVTKITQKAKDLFKIIPKPFTLKDGVDGPQTKVVFTEHFIMVMRDADSNECMAKMSVEEKKVYWDYLNYQGIVNSIMSAHPEYDEQKIEDEAKIEYEAGHIYVAPELVVRALSSWTYAEVLEFSKDTCYNTMHTRE